MGPDRQSNRRLIRLCAYTALHSIRFAKWPGPGPVKDLVATASGDLTVGGEGCTCTVICVCTVYMYGKGVVYMGPDRQSNRHLTRLCAYCLYSFAYSIIVVK